VGVEKGVEIVSGRQFVVGWIELYPLLRSTTKQRRRVKRKTSHRACVEPAPREVRELIEIEYTPNFAEEL